ncbi:hypothetical protein Tco_1578115 [Tanacetum coccineum]
MMLFINVTPSLDLHLNILSLKYSEFLIPHSVLVLSIPTTAPFFAHRLLVLGFDDGSELSVCWEEGRFCYHDWNVVEDWICCWSGGFGDGPCRFYKFDVMIHLDIMAISGENIRDSTVCCSGRIQTSFCSRWHFHVPHVVQSSYNVIHGLPLLVPILPRASSHCKANVMTDALSRKERVKPRRVRAMAMTIQYGVRGMILVAQSEAFKQENALEDIMRAYDINFGGSYHSSIRCASFEALYGRKCRSHAAKIHSVYQDPHYRRKPLEFEVGDRPFEILKRIGLIAYRLRLPEELNRVHNTFHVSNLKKCMADANLHVPLDEIKVDKTLCFVEEPVEIMD